MPDHSSGLLTYVPTPMNSIPIPSNIRFSLSDAFRRSKFGGKALPSSYLYRRYHVTPKITRWSTITFVLLTRDWIQ